MTEREKLSLSRKPKAATTTPASDENGTTERLRGNKRVIKFDRPEKKPPQQTNAPKRRKPKKPPSSLRVNGLDTELGKESKVWRKHLPLALGIERQIFQQIGRQNLSASKRVVKLLLHKHTHNKNYLVDIAAGVSRYNLDGSEAGQCTLADEEHSRRVLKKLEVEKLVKKTMRR